MTMLYTGERAIMWNHATGRHIATAHIARYAFAVDHCYKKNVVDVACGTGYGSFIISMVANSVTGIDIDERSIDYARETFETANNLTFTRGDIRQDLPLTDVYLAFECLEHLPLVDALELFNWMKEQGAVIYSVPVNDASRFHEWSMDEEGIITCFGGDIFYQAGSTIVPKSRAWFNPVHVVGVVRE